MIVHATPAQLATWLGTDAPANAASLLRSASLLVDRALIGAVYATDSTGKATDAAVLTALADATCAQADTWQALRIDPAKGAADDSVKPVTSKSIGSATITYEKTATGAASASTDARARAAVTLSDNAAQILATAGLLTTRVWTYG